MNDQVEARLKEAERVLSIFAQARGVMLLIQRDAPNAHESEWRTLAHNPARAYFATLPGK